MDQVMILSLQRQNWNRLVLIGFMLYGMISGNNETLVHKIEVLVNDMVSVLCYANAPIDIQWHFNSLLNYVFAGGRLWYPYKERFRSEDNNAGTYILIIPKVRSEDAGWYYCSEEETGRRISSTHVTVLYSIPDCYSSMHPDGFIGPNTCSLEQENMVFNCVVSFNGTSPHLIWRSLNDNRTLNSSICEDKPNRRNCSLILKSDQTYDGSIFICQTTTSDDSRFYCRTEGIKILYFLANRSITQKKVNENINCTVRSNLNFNYNWKFEQGNKYTSLGANHNLFIQEPGIYQCEVEYKIRNVSCVYMVSAVAAVVEGGTLLELTLPIVLPLVGLIVLMTGLILFRERRIRKQKRKRKQEKMELISMLEDDKIDVAKIREELHVYIGTQNNNPNEMIQKNEKIKDQVISIYKEFVSEFDPMKVFDHLIKNGIVGMEEKQKLMNNVTAKERCRALIDHLFYCCKENAFIVLTEALRKRYPGIVKRLESIDSYDENEDYYSTSKPDNEKIRNRIFGMYDDFVSDVDPVNVFDLLIQNKIVNIKQKQFIMKHAEKDERCRALLDHLIFCSKEKAFIILKEALREHYPGIVDRIDNFDTDKEAEFSTRFESCIIVAGFENDEAIGEDVVKIKINGTTEVYNAEPLPPRMRIESAAAIYGNSLFVTGLGKNCDKIWKFEARSSKWEYCNTMIRDRRRHSVAFVDHVLYICGGWLDGAETTLNNVEAYDTIDDRCTTVGKLVHAVHSAGNCVSLESSLYIFGGSDSNNVDFNYAQVYDTKSNFGTLLSKRMPVAQRLLQAALWENEAILIGIDNCFTYNFNTKTWQIKDQFKTDAVQFGMIVHNGKLFVIGGWDSTVDEDGNKKWIYRDDVRSVPVENVLKNESIEWLHHAKLPKPTGVYNFGKMEFPVQ